MMKAAEYTSSGSLESASEQEEGAVADMIEWSSSFGRARPPAILLVSFDNLSDDVVHHILSFVPSIHALAQFALASKRYYQSVYKSLPSEKLFEILYQKAFGYNTSFPNGAREQWKSLHRLQESLKYGGYQQWNHHDAPTVSQPKSVGVLTRTEETEAILYDNPSYYRDEDEQACIGYFGFHTLQDDGGDSSDGHVMVHGDFNGVRIVPSLETLLQHDDGEEKKRPAQKRSRNGRNHFEAVGERDGRSQVLTILTCPPSSDDGRRLSPSSFFLGFASGMVMAAKYSDGKHTTTSTASVHTNEVTALTWLPIGRQPSCLASGSVDGKVYVYPHAVVGDLRDAVLAISMPQSAFILSLSATRWTDTEVLLCTGDQQGLVTLWSWRPSLLPENDSSLLGEETGDVSYQFQHQQTCPSSSSSNGGILVTKVLFLHSESNVLVTGTNAGEIRVWDVQSDDDETDWDDFEPRVKIRHVMAKAHNGTIESIQTVGHILLTSGGNEGSVKGWHLKTGSLLGVIAVHAGRLYPPVRQPRRKQVVLKSAVVSTLVCEDRESLVSLCRDGTIYEWSYTADQLCRLKRAWEQMHRKRSLAQEGHRPLKVRPIEAQGGVLVAATEDQSKHPMSSIRVPHPNDVLCGQGSTVRSHPGNQQFQDLVNEQQLAYLFASRNDSTQLTMEIVRAVRAQMPPGRFLRKDESTGLWYDIGDKEAREKTGKALWEVRRDKPRSWGTY